MKHPFLLLGFLAMFSCSERKQENIKEVATTLPCREAMPDSLFKLRQPIKSTEEIDHYKREWYAFYLDHSKSGPLLALTVDEKLKYLPKTLSMSPKWVEMDIRAWYVVKQEKVGCIQPFIIDAAGTDFSAQALITVDQDGNYVSGIYLNGGENSGPLGENDSVTILRPIKKCLFEKNIIRSYVLNITAKSDHTSKVVPATVDSINYVYKIDSLGNILTKKLDSVRYKRSYRW